MRLLALFTAVAVVAATAAASSAMAGSNDGLACALIPHSKLRQVFGLPNVKQQLTVTSPDATAPGYDHTVNGSDQSECDLMLSRTQPPASAPKKLLMSLGKPIVPAGIAVVVITTNIRDEATNGDGNTWNPDNFFGDAFTAIGFLTKQFGGGHVSLPSFGSSADRSVWIGNHDHAVGMWETKGSVIRLNVFAGNSTAPARLGALAKLAVPAFTGLIP